MIKQAKWYKSLYYKKLFNYWRYPFIFNLLFYLNLTFINNKGSIHFLNSELKTQSIVAHENFPIEFLLCIDLSKFVISLGVRYI